MELSDAEYRKLVLEVAAARGHAMPAADAPVVRRGFNIGGCVVWVLAAIMFVVFVAALLPNIAASYPALSRFAGTAGVTFSTPMGAPQNTRVLPSQSRPAASEGDAPALVPFYGSPVVEEATPQPTATALPTPTPQFWTEEERAAFTATAEAFYMVIPTAPPAFTAYVDERCKDPELVAQSALLQAWCPKGE